MNIQTIKTPKITVASHSLFEILDAAITELSDTSILVITSKIVSICEGRVVKIGTIEKQQLIEQESQRFIPPQKSKYDISLTIARNMLIPTAGIDESNGNEYYVLWPADPYKTATDIRNFLIKKYKISDVGVLITDSKTTPLRWGTSGVGLAHAGFDALNNYIGTPDIFGKKLKVTKANVADGLAAAAVVAMGEGDEQTPLALITDVPFVHFSANAPTPDEIRDLVIDPQEDLYAPLIENAPWKKGSAEG